MHYISCFVVRDCSCTPFPGERLRTRKHSWRLNTMASWSFLTNHGLVLSHLGRYPDSTGLATAQAVGITERAARKIVADLLADAYIEREKVGRRNRYRLHTTQRLRHPVERAVTVGELLGLLWRATHPAGG